jgi:hypothetical protein
MFKLKSWKKMKKVATLILFLNFYFASYSQNKSDFYENKERVNLFAFVGEKISIEEFYPNKNNSVKVYDPVEKDTILRKKYVIDRAFRVKYKILKKIFNDLKTDTIEFVAYDHYGTPNFEKCKNVILYISKSTDDNYYFHQKYQYDVVYKDKTNKWFGYTNSKKSKKKKVISLETLFNNKRNGVFKELFSVKNY